MRLPPVFLRLVFRLWNDRFEHPIPGKLISARYGAPDRCRGYRILGTVTSPLEARDIRTTEGLPGSPLRLEQPGRYGAPFLRPASSGRGRASSRRTGVHEHRPGAASLHENDGISCGSLQARGEVELLPYKPPRGYNDDKRRTVTVNGITYEWQCAPDPQEGSRNVTTIFYNGTAVYRYTGAPP